MYNTGSFISQLEKLGISLSDDQISSFLKYYEMLVEKNKVMNLTAITDFDEVVTKHFTDSLSLVKAYDPDKLRNNDLKILDIGTGAGFPGIPLKIAFPNIRITLLDSLAKRVDFLNEVIDELCLSETGNADAVHSRAEDYIKENGVRASYDIVVSRAVSNLAVLSEYCIPYVCENGYFIPYKSGDIRDEAESSLNAISLLGGQIEDTVTFNLPDSDISRSLIKIKKTRPTPDKYPRKAGLPQKKPL